MGFSFFVRPGGSGKIRGKQVAEFIGGRVNPGDGYFDDVCIFVKVRPGSNFPNHTYVDVVDEMYPLGFLEKHSRANAIAISTVQIEYIYKRLGGKNNIVYIPEQHCNWERKRIPERDIKVVGTIGGNTSFQWPQEELKKKFAEIGLEWRFQVECETRFDVMKFYEGIDIQAVYRPWQKLVPFGNPLKLENAGSFGIPSVAYPEQSYYAEWKDHCLWGNTVDEIVGLVKKLKDDREFYRDMSAKAIERAEDYHIENISKLYLALGNGNVQTVVPNIKLEETPKIETQSESIKLTLTGYLHTKELVIDGEKRKVYGLASFGVRPNRRGIGTELIKGMERLAEDNGKYCIVAFCNEETWPFYQKCGWFDNGRKDNMVILTSKLVNQITVTERW